MTTTWHYQQKNGANQVILYNVDNPKEKKTVSTTDPLVLKYAPQYYTGKESTGGKLVSTGKKTYATVELKDSVTGQTKIYQRNDPLVQKYAPDDYIFSDLQKEKMKDKNAKSEAAAKKMADEQAKIKAQQNANATAKGVNPSPYTNAKLETTGPYAGQVAMTKNGTVLHFSPDSTIVQQYAPSLYKGTTTGSNQSPSGQVNSGYATDTPAEDVKALVALHNSGGLPDNLWKEFTTTGKIPQGAVPLLKNAGYQLTDQPSYSGVGSQGTGIDNTGVTGQTENTLNDINAYIDDAVTKGLITQEQADLFKLTAQGWDTSKEINMENVMTEWQKIKESTIDPYFKSQIDFQTNQLNEAISAQNAAYEQQKETERTNAGLAVRQAKDELEKAGMTFTGKSIEALGEKSPYAIPTPEGTSAIPSQTPFGGAFYEGLVNQNNRLISTSSALKNQQNLQSLGQKAEAQLGSVAAAKFGIPGYKISGGVVGAIPSAQQQAYGNTLSSLAGQQNQVNQYKNPLQFNF